MGIQTIDLRQHLKMIEALGSILRHRQTNPTHKNDELYYSLLHRYHARVREAALQGQFIASHTVVIPTEIFYAMDLVPMHLEFTANTLSLLLRNQEEMLSTAKAIGYTPEVCSAHRVLAAFFAKGWSPPANIVIWSNQVCDNTAKAGDYLVESYKVPGFFLDRPYRFTEKEVQYLTRELEELIARLEELSGHKMDWDRLQQVMDYSAQMVKLHREIYELRRAIPYPTANRRSEQMTVIMWYFQGTPEGVSYMESVRDELKERVEKGIGYIPQERHRLLALFLPPFHKWKLLDWMQHEYGASIVAEPYTSHWGEWEPDFRNPIESLARKQFATPVCREMHGPMEEGVIADAVADALSHKAEGALYWAHVGCRQACATIRSTKDALMEKLGLPTLVVDIDVMDPTFVGEEEIKDKLEGFFELLQERK